MKKMKFTGMLMPVLIAIFLSIPFSQTSCKVKSCEVKITNKVVTCDGTNCPSDRKCVLQKRKKGTENPWQDTTEPEDEDAAFEYRCLCRK